MDSSIINNEARHRYEMQVDGEIVFVNYRREGNTLFLLHVEAPPVLRGTGAAGRFMEGLMQTMRTENLRVVPICGYAVAWLSRHQEHKDLVAQPS